MKSAGLKMKSRKPTSEKSWTLWDDEKESTDKNEIAEIFNEYFIKKDGSS